MTTLELSLPEVIVGRYKTRRNYFVLAVNDLGIAAATEIAANLDNLISLYQDISLTQCHNMVVVVVSEDGSVLKQN